MHTWNSNSVQVLNVISRWNYDEPNAVWFEFNSRKIRTNHVLVFVAGGKFWRVYGIYLVAGERFVLRLDKVTKRRNFSRDVFKTSDKVLGIWT